MKLREVFRYEAGYRLRSGATWLYAAILFGIAVIAVHAQAEDATAHANAPVTLAILSIVVGMFGLMITAAMFGDAAVRDVESGMDPLVHTAPLSRIDYLGGRFFATLLVNALILLAVPIGLMAGAAMLDAPVVGPLRAAAFLQPWFLLLLPNLVLTGAVLFTAGVLARQVIPVYLAAIALVISFLVAMQTLSRFENVLLLMLADPLGIGVITDLAQDWTIAERNSRLIGYPMALVLGRAVWLAIAAAVLGFLHSTFRFAHHDGGGRARASRAEPASAGNRHALDVPRIDGKFGMRTSLCQTAAVARDTLSAVAATRWFGGVLIATLLLTLLFTVGEVGDTVFDTSTWPLTMLVIETIMASPLVPMTFLLLTVYAGELVWKDRETGSADIVDATPVPEGALLGGRFLALAVMILVIQAAITAGGMLLQTLLGHTHHEPGLYLAVMFGLRLAGLLFLAAIAMATHVVVNQKYVAHVVVVLAFLFPVIAEDAGLLRHHLVLYGTDPGWVYSGMNGFGPFLEPVLWFRLYWGVWALLLGVLATAFWIRGRESGMRRRLRAARQRATGPVLRAAGSAIVLIAGLGGFIFYNTNVVNDYDAAATEETARALYERRYGGFRATPQPRLTHAELRIDVRSDIRGADITGRYTLVNRTSAPVDSLHVWLYEPELHAHSIETDRPSRTVLEDEQVRYRIIALDQPLAPGDSLQLTFGLSYRPRGFRNGRPPTAVTAGSATLNRAWLPFVGYRSAAELSDAATRLRLGLTRQAPVPGPRDMDADMRKRKLDRLDADVVNIETVVSTGSDQVAVAPGELRRTWSENGRRHFHYGTTVPVPFGAAIMSGRYEAREGRWNDVTLRIFHHPSHTYTIDRMMRAMQASLEYYSTQFGTYPDRELRIVETPRYGGNGASHPHTISFTEDNFLSHVRSGQVDQPFYGVAHETAHQWWGGQVRGAHVRGHGLLSESLANYSAMMVMEKSYGSSVAQRIHDFQLDHYLRGRAGRTREVPLLEIQDEGYLAYRKGAVALYTLRRRIGEERMSLALRHYLEKFRGADIHPTSLDLYGELQAVTPDSLRPLLTDLFETVTVWDVKVERASVVPAGDGAVVSLAIVARKIRTDSAGSQTDVAMDDAIEIGVFARGEKGRQGEPLYLERHRIRSGAQTITIRVAGAPARAGIDPRNELIDLKRADNVVDLPSPGTQREQQPPGPTSPAR